MAEEKAEVPTGKALLIIASGGSYTKGFGKAKAYDSKGSTELAVELDIERARRHWGKMNPYHWDNVKDLRAANGDRDDGYTIYGELKYKGKAGKTSGAKDEIIKFMKDKGSAEKYIYYTGHGNKDGDWCFTDGYITFEWIFAQIMEMKKPDPKVSTLPHCGIYSDCCYSGVWAKKLTKVYPKETHSIWLYTASTEKCKAYDNQFSKIFGTFKSYYSSPHLRGGFLPEWYVNKWGGYRCFEDGPEQRWK